MTSIHLSDAAVFILVVVGLNLAMFCLLTTYFINMIPDGDRCPLCDGDTQALEARGLWRVLNLSPRNRRSWCVHCGWEGILRRSDEWMRRDRERRRAWRQALAARSRSRSRSSMTNKRIQSGQFPLSSKKSS